MHGLIKEISQLRFKMSGFCKFLVIAFLLSFHTFSFSEITFTCDDEEEIDFNLAQDPNEYVILIAKAGCLFNKGKHGDALIYLGRSQSNKGVLAGYLWARYLESDRTFKEEPDDLLRRSEIVDSTIGAYYQVLTLIGTVPNYPPESDITYGMYEAKNHLTIDTYYTIARLYLARYYYQLMDHDSHLVQGSPTFNTSPETTAEALYVQLYPDVAHFDGPVYSLNHLEQAASNCKNVPYMDFWDKNKYDRYIKACKSLRDFAIEARVLESKRIYKSGVCKDFIANETKACKEYFAITQELVEKISAMNKEINNAKL